MESKKVLYVSQEVYPYVPETTLSKLGNEMPQSVHGREFEARIFTPKYSCINERRNQLHEVIRLSGLNLSIDDNDHPLIIKVATLLPSRMQVYFIDNDDYFHPTETKGLETELLPDENDERLMFFTAGTIETVKKLRWQPAIVHCSGWVSALVPVYLRHKYADDPVFRAAKIVYSLQPESFGGTLDARLGEKLALSDIPASVLGEGGAEGVDWTALNKLAIDNADAVMVGAEDVLPELIDYAQATGKPVMPFTVPEERKEALLEFYRKLTAADGDED